MIDIGNIDPNYWEKIKAHEKNLDIFFNPSKIIKTIPDVLLCDNKLYTVDKYGEKKPIANFIPIIVEMIVDDDGNTQKITYIIVGRKSDGKNIKLLKAIDVPAAELIKMTWIDTQWGALDARIYSDDSAGRKILYNVMLTFGEYTAIKKTIYHQTGWLPINNTMCYLHGSGVIGTTDNVDVKLDGDLKEYGLPDNIGDKDERDDALRTVMSIADKHVIIPIIALVFLSPLNEFLRQAGCEPAFVLYYLCRTQCRKSTLVALMLSFFGNFTYNHLPGCFDDTICATAIKGHILKDTLYTVDDYHPANPAKKREMDQLMQSLSRMYGNRCAMDRMTPGRNLASGNIPRGNVVVTGEDIPDIGQSGLSRVLFVDMPKDAIPVCDALNKAQQYAQDGVLGAIMRDYIESLRSQVDRLPHKLKELYAMYCERAQKDGVSGLGRTGDIIAWLMIGWYMLIEYVQNRGIADIDFMDTWDVLKEIAVSQNDLVAENTPTHMFTDAVAQMLNSGKIYTCNLDDTVEMVRPNNKMIGYNDSNNYYFFPNDIYDKVCKFFSSQHKTFPLSYKTFLKRLSDDNICISGKNHHTLEKRIGKTIVRLLCIPKAYIDP